MKRRRVLSLLLVAIIVGMSGFSASPPITVNADDTNVVKNVTSHDIAIIFDNSGSMYENESWCRALYAMEVFASMLDYEHDKLGIYPMGDIQIGKSGNIIKDRLDISSADDIKNIEQIYCQKSAETILKPAYTAAEYLKKSKLDEKWLIILTDGAFFKDKSSSEKKEEKTGKWLEGKLKFFSAITGINVQYLGFAEASKIKGDNSFSATNASSADELPKELVEICNKIFQRDAISNVNGGKFDIDVSMNSIIAFAQGTGAKINALMNDRGDVVDESMNITLQAGTLGAGNYPNAPVADVAGQVVTFNNCEAGSYTLDYIGSNVQLFYEPNVVVNTELTDSSGTPVDLSDTVLPGDYTLKYGLMDAATGKDVTSSPLLSPVSLNAKVKNGEKTNDHISSGEKIHLDVDSDTEISVAGTFLNRYTITNLNEGETFKINVKPPDINQGDLSVKVSVKNIEMGRKWYKLSNHDHWKPIRVDVRYKNQKLTDEQLKNAMVLSFSPSDKSIPYRIEIVERESAYNIFIGQDADGKYIAPQKGTYSIKASISLIDEYGRSIENSDRDGFEVQNYSPIWRWLIWVVIAAALALLIIFVMNLPAWPRKMRFVVEKPKVDEGVKTTIKIRSTGMRLVPYEDAVSCRAKKNSKVKDWLFHPKSMSIICYDFSSEEIRSFKTGGRVYTDTGEGFACRGIENEIIFNGSQFDFTFLNGTRGSGHIEIY